MSEKTPSEVKPQAAKAEKKIEQEDLATIIHQAIHDVASGQAPSLHQGLAEVAEEPGVL